MPINLKQTSAIGAGLMIAGLAMGFVGYKTGAVTAMSWEHGPHLVKTVTNTQDLAADSLKTIQIDADNYEIVVNRQLTSTKASVKMTYDQTSKPQVSVKNGELVIDASAKSSNSFNIGFLGDTDANKITISLPEKTYEIISISTGNGAVNIKDAYVKQLTVNADNGALRLNNIKVNTLNSKLNNGAVKGSNVTVSKGGEISANNGVIAFSNLISPSLTASTNNGVVKVQGDKFGTNYEKIEEGQAPLKLHADNGAIEIK
jgi:DUF4097 and DUF4098 domain-containing protein YvlB